jgi:hypothetical protein
VKLDNTNPLEQLSCPPERISIHPALRRAVATMLAPR